MIKRELLILYCIFLVLIFLVGAKYVGFVVQNTSSKVSIDSGVIVIYNDFSGSTTDFLHLNDSQLENISNMIIEIPKYGKIIINEPVNLSKDVVNNTIDLDKNIIVSNNFLFINTSSLSSLEKPATLYLYNLSFSNPRILRNGEVCPSSVCQKISYSGGTLIFTTNQFSNYSTEETPIETTASSPSGGGSGGGSETIKKKIDFTIDKSLIKVTLKQGENKRETLEIMNTGEKTLNISLGLDKINNFLLLSENFFVLEPGKVKIINIDFFAKDEEIPDAYLGRIIVKGEGIEKIIGVIIEVKAKQPLFDIKTSVIEKSINKGDSINSEIKIINMGDINLIDILLYYAIKDFEGNTISFKEESLALEKELNVKRELKTFNDAQFGRYIFYSKISYKNISAASVDIFEIKEPFFEKIKYSKNFQIFVAISIIILILIFLILIYIVKKNFSLWSFFKKESQRIKDTEDKSEV